MKIIVTGSLGHIGKPLTEILIEKGFDVAVISSSQARKNEIEEIGAKAMIGSVEDADFLSKAFAGADAVFAMNPPNYEKQDQVKYYTEIAENYARAIEANKIGRVVYLSSYGAHLEKETGYILGSHFAEEILGKLAGTHITYLRAGYFYYNLFGYTEMIRQQGEIATNYGGNDFVPLVSPKDIARAAAEELEKQDNFKKVRYVVSDEKTAQEIAAVLGTAIGKPELKWKTLTDQQMAEGMRHRHIPEEMIKNWVEMGAKIHNGELVGDYRKNKPEKLGEIKLEDFAEEFARGYKQEN